jgi:hypothetical protein
LSSTCLSHGPGGLSLPFEGSMTSLACWLVVVVDDVVDDDDDVAAASALLTPNGSGLDGGVILVLGLGKDVEDVIIQRTFAGLAGVGSLNIAVYDLQSKGCCRRGSQRLFTAFAFAFSYDGGVFW